MEAIEAITRRRSTRRYAQKAVEPEKIELIIEAGRHAPSGGNNQKSHFFVVTRADVMDRLASLAQEAFSKMEVTEDMYSSLRSSVVQSKKGGYRFCYNAPVLIIIANEKNYGNHTADMMAAAENMMIAANALDLGSCFLNQLNWLNEEPALLDYMTSLGMSMKERVYGAVIIGYADTDDGLPARKPLPRTGNEVTYIK